MDFRELATKIRNRVQIRNRLRYLRYHAGLEPVRQTTFLGHDFYFPATSLIGQGVAEGKDHDSVFRDLARLIPELGGGLVVDVGANLGTTSLQLLAGNAGLKVLAVEPSKRYSALLNRNLNAAGAMHVETASTLLGRNRGTAWLHDNSSSASVTRAKYDGHGPLGKQRLQMFTLDDLLNDRGPVSMIKTDCDGYDLEVLRGGVQTLQAYRPLLYLEFAPHLGEEIAQGMEWLQQIGYKSMYCLGPPDGTFLMQTEIPAEAVAAARRQTLGYLDVICPHQDSMGKQVKAALMEMEQTRSQERLRNQSRL